MWRRPIYALFLLVVAFIAAEVLLRLLDPFGIRVRGNHITLPRNVDHVWKNQKLPGVDTLILMHRNGLGFRGPELPSDTTGVLRVLAVGGSTTECQYLSDGQDWPALMAAMLDEDIPSLWVNNAGLDGHSTFGHHYLLKDLALPLRPHVILLLVGANEVGRDDIGWYDLVHVDNGRKAWDWAERCELIATWNALADASAAKRGRIRHEAIRPDQRSRRIQLGEPMVERALRREEPLIDRYAERLKGLVQLCRAQGAEPVLITQPCLFSSAIDPTTGLDLSTLERNDSLNGALVARKIALYNERTKAMGKALGAFTIDLATQLPGNTRHFYDTYHFTKAGSAAVARLVTQALIPYLSARYPQHLKHGTRWTSLPTSGAFFGAGKSGGSPQ